MIEIEERPQTSNLPFLNNTFRKIERPKFPSFLKDYEIDEGIKSRKILEVSGPPQNRYDRRVSLKKEKVYDFKPIDTESDHSKSISSLSYVTLLNYQNLEKLTVPT